MAAAQMGAGIIECDVTFTRDRELVCRHSQCDLHTTTNILATPLAQKCSVPPDFNSATPFAEVQCCTSDITLAEFKTLHGKMDAGNPRVRTVADYLNSTAAWRTDLYAHEGTLMTHAESISLFDELGVGMTPELKEALVPLPFDGDYTRQDQADQMLQDYRDAGIDPSRVWPQSFEEEDIAYWLSTAPDFAAQLVYLDDRYNDEGFDHLSADTWTPGMNELQQRGVRWLAPPLWMLLTLDEQQNIVPSAYARAAKEVGLNLIAWSLERSGPLHIDHGGWYYQSVAAAINNDGDALRVLDVLARDVGVSAVFSDWPATTSYYAHCRL
jgi:glycerophosphoryl diester phosphodiesterase